MTTIKTEASQYAKDNSTGNSYYDDKIKAAYIAGANDALQEAVDQMMDKTPPYYQRKIKFIADELKA